MLAPISERDEESGGYRGPYLFVTLMVVCGAFSRKEDFKGAVMSLCALLAFWLCLHSGRVILADLHVGKAAALAGLEAKVTVMVVGLS